MSDLVWPVKYGDDGQCDALAVLSDESAAQWEQAAGEYLWRYTGRRFGLSEGTIRPCRQQDTAGLSTYGPSRGGSPWIPSLVGGRWFNVACGLGHGNQCGCDWGSVLAFEMPVASVTEVQIDGQVLDASAYRVDNSRLLVRQDGGRWPFCQDLSRPLGQDDTWGVTVQTGQPVPIGGQVAAAKLACEFAKAMNGDKACELPQRWQTITRQGVTISAAIDTFQGLDEGKTGIWLIDSWVASVTKPDIGFSMASPDYSPARVTGGTV